MTPNPNPFEADDLNAAKGIIFSLIIMIPLWFVCILFLLG